MILRLNPFERDVLNHRLEVPEAIVESIIDNDTNPMKDKPKHLIQEMVFMLHEGKYQLAAECDIDLMYEVLRNCVENGTYRALLIEEDRQGHKLADHSFMWRACDELAGKVSTFIGELVEYPQH